MTEAKQAEADASAKRLALYADAREAWHFERDGWDEAVKTMAYRSLSKLWSAMNRLEQKCAGMDPVMRYH